MSWVIQCQGLVKRFGTVRAVDRLGLEVPRGKVYAFLGPNGAGKTTVLRLLLGLLEPDEGEARVLGLDPTREVRALRRRVGVLLEHDGLYERLTVRANLEIWGRLYGLPKHHTRRRAEDLLQEMDLHDRRRDRVHDLSRGMRRKLAVARALIPEPELLILDEPSIGLDPHALVDLRQRLVRLAREEDTTVLLTTHNLHEAERTADRVGVISQGRLIESGTPSELFRRHGASHILVTGEHLDKRIAGILRPMPGVLSVDPHGFGDTLRIRLEPDTNLAPLLERIVREGGEVEATRRHNEDLEEIFLHLIRERNQGLRTRHEPRPVPIPVQEPSR